MKTFHVVLALTLAAGSSIAQAQSPIYVYPAVGQSDEQLQADRYECHRWAVDTTGFDPLHSKPIANPARVKVPRNRHAGATEKGLLGGVLAGAAIGEIDANNPGKGAAIGAVVGSLIGSVVERSGARDSYHQAREQRQALKRDKREQRLAQANYQRAEEACLEGRGYSVK